MADKLRIVNRALQRIGAKRLASLTENSRERLSVDAAYDDVVARELMTNFWTFAIRRTEITANNEQHAASATIAAGGAGYVVGEVLTVVGGTGTAAEFIVDEVSGGAVTAVSAGNQRGDYAAVPANPASTTASAGGAGCTLTITYETGPRFGRSYSYDKPADFLRSAPYDPHEATLFRSLLFEGNLILADDPGPLQLRYVRDLSINLPTGITNKEELFHPLFANAVSMSLAMELAEELVGSSAKLDRVEAAYLKFVADARRVDAIEQGPIEPDIDEFVAVRITSRADPTLRKYS